MVLPSEGGNNELEKMIKQVTGRKKFKDRKPIFNILDILTFLAFGAVPVLYNMNHEIINNPFIAWMLVLSFFCFTRVAEGHIEGFKAQRIFFLAFGVVLLLVAIALGIL
jgi:hypothetical protein